MCTLTPKSHQKTQICGKKMCDLLNMPDYVNMEAPFLFYLAIYNGFCDALSELFWNRAYLVLLRNLRNHRSPQNLLDGIHKYFCLQKQR